MGQQAPATLRREAASRLRRTFGHGASDEETGQQFGTRFASFDSNGGLTPFVVNFAIRHYVVPDHIRAIALNKTWPVTVRATRFASYNAYGDFVPARGILWTNYLTRDFALGSQTGYHGFQEMPVFLAFRSRRKRRSLFFKSDPPIAVLASAQNAGLLLGGFSVSVR